MAKPYVLASPKYDPTSGGIKVMWGLYGHLLARGVEVYMNEKPMGRDVIAIYPEIQAGNPVQTDTIIRYVLNKPGLMGGIDSNGRFTPGPSMFDDSEKVYYFSRLFGETDESHYLFLPVINLHIFKDQKKLRNKTCYLIGKGVNRSQHPQGSIELNRQVAQDQQALCDLLNECHTFYCYDNLTAMMEVARLCGTKVRYYGEYEKDELQLYEPGLNGIAWRGEDDRKLDTDAFRSHYRGLVDTFNTKIDQLIEDTQI